MNGKIPEGLPQQQTMASSAPTPATAPTKTPEPVRSGWRNLFSVFQRHSGKSTTPEGTQRSGTTSATRVPSPLEGGRFPAREKEETSFCARCLAGLQKAKGAFSQKLQWRRKSQQPSQTSLPTQKDEQAPPLSSAEKKPQQQQNVQMPRAWNTSEQNHFKFKENFFEECNTLKMDDPLWNKTQSITMALLTAIRASGGDREKAKQLFEKNLLEIRQGQLRTNILATEFFGLNTDDYLDKLLTDGYAYIDANYSALKPEKPIDQTPPSPPSASPRNGGTDKKIPYEEETLRPPAEENPQPQQVDPTPIAWRRGGTFHFEKNLFSEYASLSQPGPGTGYARQIYGTVMMAVGTGQNTKQKAKELFKANLEEIRHNKSYISSKTFFGLDQDVNFKKLLTDGYAYIDAYYAQQPPSPPPT